VLVPPRTVGGHALNGIEDHACLLGIGVVAFNDHIYPASSFAAARSPR
jgi:hypothetical protein